MAPSRPAAATAFPWYLKSSCAPLDASVPANLDNPWTRYRIPLSEERTTPRMPPFGPAVGVADRLHLPAGRAEGEDGKNDARPTNARWTAATRRMLTPARTPSRSSIRSAPRARDRRPRRDVAVPTCTRNVYAGRPPGNIGQTTISRAWTRCIVLPPQTGISSMWTPAASAKARKSIGSEVKISSPSRARQTRAESIASSVPLVRCSTPARLPSSSSRACQPAEGRWRTTL